MKKDKHLYSTVKLFLLLQFFVFTSDALSQSDTNHLRKNGIKLNILPPLLSATGEISYERFISPNLSIVAGIGTNFRSYLSDLTLHSDSDLSFFDRNVDNNYFLAEVRQYLDFCECKPSQGFYVGGFLRYNDFKYTSKVQFEENNTNLDVEINIDFQSINFGGLLGYQINLKNWLIDFEFLGFGYSPNWIQFSSNTTLSSDELEALSDALSRNFGIGGYYREIELNSSSYETSFWYWSFRYAISIGYHF